MSTLPLTIEQFHDGEESKFLIQSPREIQLILCAISQKKIPAVIYFNAEQNFIKTRILTANEKGIWVDVGPDAAENNLLLNSDDIILVTQHQQAKVQFNCHQLELAVYASHPAFFFPLPQSMLRIQRRDSFRLPIPADAPLKCRISPKLASSPEPVEITLMDISVGGIALVCREQNVNLQAGEIYPDCRIELPGLGTLVATVQVKNLFDITSSTGNVTKHAGCEFVQLDGKMSMLLQRYIALMQSKISGLH